MEDDTDVHEIDAKIVKQERTSTEIKPKLEVAQGSEVHAVNELASFASVYVVEPQTNICEDYHELDIKTEIKQEPDCLEQTLNLESEETHIKDADLQLDTENDASEADEEFILPESRLDAVTSAGTDKNDSKLRAKSGPCHEKYNTNAIQGCEKRGTSRIYDKMSHECGICGKCFSLASDLQTHKVLIHKDKRRLKCDKCDKSYISHSGLKAHKLIHEGIRPFKCDKCEKSYTTVTHLKTHYVIHEDKTPFTCNKCDKSFTTVYKLKAHNLIHEGNSPFTCSKCDKSFTQLSNLKAHNLIHEGKRPFKCNKCDKTFTTAQNLKTHNLIHEGIRPFKCTQCDKSFRNSSNLKTHSFIHEGKRPFKCNTCDKSLSSAHNLKTHRLMHEDKRPFNLNTCDMEYTVAQNLKRQFNS